MKEHGAKCQKIMENVSTTAGNTSKILIELDEKTKRSKKTDDFLY